MVEPLRFSHSGKPDPPLHRKEVPARDRWRMLSRRRRAFWSFVLVPQCARNRPAADQASRQRTEDHQRQRSGELPCEKFYIHCARVLHTEDQCCQQQADTHDSFEIHRDFIVPEQVVVTETTAPELSLLPRPFIISEERWLNEETARRMNASWCRPSVMLGRGRAVAYGVFTPRHCRQVLI